MVLHSELFGSPADVRRESSVAHAKRIWRHPGVIRDAAMVAGSHPWDKAE